MYDSLHASAATRGELGGSSGGGGGERVGGREGGEESEGGEGGEAEEKEKRRRNERKGKKQKEEMDWDNDDVSMMFPPRNLSSQRGLDGQSLCDWARVSRFAAECSFARIDECRTAAATHRSVKEKKWKGERSAEVIGAADAGIEASEKSNVPPKMAPGKGERGGMWRTARVGRLF